MDLIRGNHYKVKVLTAVWLMFLTIQIQCVAAPKVKIQNVEGWFESAYIQWEANSAFNSYQVSVLSSDGQKQQIDPQLIRNYGSYFRADALGLKPGTYQFEIVPVQNQNNQTSTKSKKIKVKAHDRSGFAFTSAHSPGAYQADGTLKENAVVLYVTEKNKDKISLNVIGASQNPCVGIQEILFAYKKGKETRPLNIRIIGELSVAQINEHGDLMVENDNNPLSAITIEGVGNDATLNGWGIRMKNASNVEIRNLGVMNCNSEEGDDISLQQDNEYVWVHHCDFFYGNPGTDEDQVKGDGALDCKKSTYITFSYNHFWDNGKTNLLGLNENTTDNLYITYHHNWYDHSDARHPRIRFYSAHVYNNYYDGNSKYGIGATMGASVFAEGNYFRHCKYPFLTSMQGTIVYDEDLGKNDYEHPITLSGENGGVIKAYNNYIEDAHRFVAYGDATYPNATVDFDAYVAQSKNEVLSADIIANYGKTTYNNFDTRSDLMYPYQADTPEEARNKVMSYAGRMQGGDFKWTFQNEVDDKSSKVNQPLKDALLAYQTSLQSIPADTLQYQIRMPEVEGDEEQMPVVIPDLKPVTKSIEHVFTTDGLVNDDIFFYGNLSDSKGSIDYQGNPLNVCLKVESSTQIKFVTASETVLNLVFSTDFEGTVKVDGEKYKAAAGKLQLTLNAGEHTILKGSSAYLFVMTLTVN